ncbi:MAG TPA: hypothetical protein VEZ14_01960 [Dehalococcoidia bacterium]|nr:hypothetical protein [Dehalococcoidia bacterium]
MRTPGSAAARTATAVTGTLPGASGFPNTGVFGGGGAGSVALAALVSACALALLAGLLWFVARRRSWPR